MNSETEYNFRIDTPYDRVRTVSYRTITWWNRVEIVLIARQTIFYNVIIMYSLGKLILEQNETLYILLNISHRKRITIYQHSKERRLINSVSKERNATLDSHLSPKIHMLVPKPAKLESFRDSCHCEVQIHTIPT